MRLHLRSKQSQLTLDLQREGAAFRVKVGGVEHRIEVQPAGAATLVLMIDGRCHRVAIVRRGTERLVGVGGETYSFVSEGAPSAHRVETVAVPEIVAPMPGKILQMLVRPGDRVSAGDPILILEAMKMETRLLAEAAATVIEVRAATGDMVDGGQILVVLAYDASAQAD
jgi:biotin carboxyl carrier protein